jgi:hypothetical protein
MFEPVVGINLDDQFSPLGARAGPHLNAPVVLDRFPGYAGHGRHVRSASLESLHGQSTGRRVRQ